MYTRWMAKLSGLYQLPLGFNVSGTFNAREGWSVPHYFTLYDYDAPNYTAGYGNTIYTQPQTDDALPTFYNVTLRLEKKINIGTGRLYLMADIFNLLNSNMAIRSYSENFGSAYFRDAGATPTFQQYNSAYYNFTGLRNEVLNPRIIEIRGPVRVLSSTRRRTKARPGASRDGLFFFGGTEGGKNGPLVAREVGLERAAPLLLGDVALVGQHLLLGPLRALPLLAADLGDPPLLGARFSEDVRLDLVGQDAPGQEPVQGLRPLLLALDLGTRREVLEVNAGRDLVDVLSAVAARADELLDDVRLADAERVPSGPPRPVPCRG